MKRQKLDVKARPTFILNESNLCRVLNVARALFMAANNDQKKLLAYNQKRPIRGTDKFTDWEKDVRRTADTVGRKTLDLWVTEWNFRRDPDNFGAHKLNGKAMKGQKLVFHRCEPITVKILVNIIEKVRTHRNNVEHMDIPFAGEPNPKTSLKKKNNKK